MFEHLTEGFERFVRYLRGQGKITPQNVKETLREVRKILLEADVSLPVVKIFLDKVSAQALGQEVLDSITPGQQMVKIIYDEMVKILGGDQEPLHLGKSPSSILIVGLNGSGKTTTAAKLALHLKKKGRKPLLVAGDNRRPAAREQLVVLGNLIDVPVIRSDKSSLQEAFIQAKSWAYKEGFDILIIDTAGRMHINEELMTELTELYSFIKPSETLLVVDGMTGQDAVRSAQSFVSALPITGIVITKLEGDTRGGAAFSLRYMTGKPIKFIGVGEKVSDLEPFYPQRIAGRLLGMGDVLTLVEKAQEVAQAESDRSVKKKFLEGQLTLEDFKEQLVQISRLGPIENILGMIPGLGKFKNKLNTDNQQVKWAIAIINSMTPEERRNPRIINGSRRLRIARGSGRSVSEVNRLLKQFEEIKAFTKRMKGLKKGMLPTLWGN